MLSADTLAKLDALALIARDYARGGAGGARRSRALGSSAEFSDYREYAPGDDTRRVDWNAYARFDKLFLKLFMEERELCLTIELDASASMAAKWDFSARLAEAFAYVALRRGDRAQILALSGEAAATSQVFSGRAGFINACRFIDNIVPKGDTRLSRAVSRAAAPTGRGMAVLISDLFSEDGYETALKTLLYRKQETTLLHVLAPEEIVPDMEGALRLIDSEGARPMDILMNRDALEAYGRAFTEFTGGARAFCRARGIAYALLRSDADIASTLLGECARAGVIA